MAMPKAIHKETSSTPFPFSRQFTAPPFFTGLEDAKLRSQLLLAAVNKSVKVTAETKPKKSAAKKAVKKPGKATKKK